MKVNNLQLLGSNDVLFASYPGAGSTWFGSLFVSLSVFYVEGYHEQLIDNQNQKTIVLEKIRRQHLPVLYQRDAHSRTYREPLRVIKTHMLPESFSDILSSSTNCKVVLLIRDGRDTVLSHYHWLKAFEGYRKSLLGFLQDFGTKGPPLDWAEYHLAWLKALSSESIHVVSFESCRQDPCREISNLLEFLGLKRSVAEIESAIEKSSYERMRLLESNEIQKKGEEIGHGRIMRRGKVGGWIDEFGNAELETFQDLPNETLKVFGYQVADDDVCCGH